MLITCPLLSVGVIEISKFRFVFAILRCWGSPQVKCAFSLRSSLLSHCGLCISSVGRVMEQPEGSFISL